MSFLLRFLPSFAPMLGPLLNPWVLLGLVLLLTGAAGFGGFYGYRAGVSQLHEYQAEQASAAVAIVVKRGKVTEKIVNRYIKVKGETEVLTRTIEKEVIRYVESGLDRCPLSRAAVGLHDAAAANQLPDPASTTDGTASGIETATLTQTCAKNYATYHQTADRLRALQAWVTEQGAVTP